MQKDDQNKLYSVVKNHVSKQSMLKMNQHKSWQYGYNPNHDLVVISKNGTVGEIYNINGLLIGLPKQHHLSTSRTAHDASRLTFPLLIPIKIVIFGLA
mgnify:CR=1 FL=1